MIELVKGVVREGLQSEFVDELKVLSGHIDSALTKHYLRLKKAGVKIEAWMEQHKNLACLLMDRADVEAVMSAAGDYEAVALQVGRLAQGTRLGHALFDFLALLVNHRAYGRAVEELINELTRQQPITAAAVAEFQEKAAAAVCRHFSVDLLPPKRQIDFQYLGQAVATTVQDPTLEWELRLFAALKTAALQSKTFPRLRYEEWILPAATSETDIVDKALLAPLLLARQLASKLLQAKDIDSVEMMKTALAEKGMELVSLDKTFRIELDYVESHLAPALLNILEGQLLLALPSGLRVLSMTMSSLELSKIATSDLAKMLGGVMQRKIEAVQEIVQHLFRGIAPDQTIGDASSFYKNVLAQLPFFVRHGTLSGSAALKEVFKELQQKVAMAPKELLLSDLEQVQAFKWLLGTDDQTSLAELVKTALNNVTAISKSKTSQAPGAFPKPAAGSKSSSSKTAAPDVMSFFT